MNALPINTRNGGLNLTKPDHQFVKFGPCSRAGCKGTATGSIYDIMSTSIDEMIYCTPCGKKIAASRNRKKRNAELRR